MRPIVAATFLVLAATPVMAPKPAAAGSVKAPRLLPGDSWTYENDSEVRGIHRVSHDTATLTRVDSHVIAIEVHTVGASAPGPERLMGPDWSRVRSVNGQQTVVNRPLVYPLTPGKTWTLAYSETTPANRFHTKEQWHMVYKVTGWEDIAVAAGVFHALKVEGEGTWTAELPSNTLTSRSRAPNGTDVAVATNQAARTISGRFFRVVWYVPEVHRWARSEEDIYDTNGERTEHVTASLEAFTLTDPGAPDAGDAGPESPRAEAPPPRAKHVKAPRPAPAPAPRPLAKKPHPAPPPALAPLQETRLTGPWIVKQSS